MEEAIAVLGLEPLLARFPSQLSGGQAQRLALASALRRGPDLILYDEATTALDPLARNRFGTLVNSLSRRGHALIMIGQRARMLEPYAHRMMAMVAGCLTDPVAVADVSTAEQQTWSDLWKSLDSAGLTPSPVGLELKGVQYRYRGSDAFTFGPLDTHVNPGEIIALVGENGSGKSTLFKLILGAFRPKMGQLRFSTYNKRIFHQTHDVSLNALFQNPSVQLIGSTIAEELKASLEALDISLSVGLIDRIFSIFPFLHPDRDPLELSYGQQKILCLLGLSAGGHGLILLDEPEQGLDERHLALLRNWLDHLRRGRRRTLLFATHDLEFAASCADRVWIFSQGNLAGDYLQPCTKELVAAFHGY